MKFISKAEEKKIELQIESLRREATELGSQLLKAQADTAKNQAEAATALAAATQALATTQSNLDSQAQELARKTAELARAQVTTAKFQQDSEAVNKALADAQAQLAATLNALEAKHKDLPAIAAELAAAQAALNAGKAEASQAKQEAEVAAAAIQAQLDDAIKSAAQAKAQQAAAANELHTKAKALDAKSQELEAKNKEFTAKATELVAAQAQTKAAQAEASKAKQEAEAARKSAEDAKAQQAAADKELNIKAKELEVKSKKLEAKNKEFTTLKAKGGKQAKLALQTEAKYQDSAQENGLLLLQLMQAQEELVEYYEQKSEFEKLYLAYKARWDRLEKRLPNYLDFGVIDIADVDGVSDVPAITWQVKDLAQSGMALSEFSFVTVLQDGHPGMGLIKDGQPHPFVPKLMGTHEDQLATFLALGTTDFKQLTAAISILEQLEAVQWAGFEFPKQFDLSFWRPSIKALIGQVKLLPALLRYDEVRLKRELINPDYEHLWLEFRGMSLGASQWKMFEIRLGAALVQVDGFSQYPKFEIPLIDGKTKPFDSWYPENQDDSGAKLELRFALDKNVFDVAVWSKLSNADKALVLRVIYAMPEALKRLQKQKAAIHRPWATWIDFAAGAVKVLEATKAAAKVAAQQALEVPKLANTAELQPSVETPALAAPASAAPPASSAPSTQLTPTGPKAGKVISIAVKPVSKPKPVHKQALAAKPKTTAMVQTAAKAAERAKA